jgi:hypothetical protein
MPLALISTHGRCERLPSRPDHQVAEQEHREPADDQQGRDVLGVG